MLIFEAMQSSIPNINQLSLQYQGKPLDSLDHWKFDTAAQLPIGIITATKQIPDLFDQIEFISYFVPSHEWPSLKSFVIRELRNGNYPEEGNDHTWFSLSTIGDILISSLKELYGDVFYSAINGRIIPEIDDWKNWGYLEGIFTTIVMTSAYPLTQSGNLLPLRTKGRIFESVFDSPLIPIYFRRWIAQRIAHFFYQKGILQAPLQLSELYSIAPKNSWSDDAQIALNGLIREMENGMINLDQQVPGFSGPDEWYS